MRRTDIHQQISEVTEKIQLLNRQLSQSTHLLKAETDLLLVYTRELQQLINQLTPEADTSLFAEKKEVAYTDNTLTETTRGKTHKASIADVEKDQKISDSPAKIASSQQAAAATPHAVSASPIAPSINERFKRNTVELGEKLQAQTGRHLKDFFSRSDRFMFVNELFNKESQHFEETIKLLNDMESWDEAFRFIEQELRNKFNWNKKQDIVDHFQQIVKKRFLKTGS